MSSVDRRAGLRQMLNKVPEVTAYFWVIKVLCTTVGETASDYLSDNVGLGLTKTTFITAALLIATLVFQFRARRYVAGIYWTGIVLISVVTYVCPREINDGGCSETFRLGATQETFGSPQEAASWVAV